MKSIKLSLIALLFSIALPAGFAHASFFNQYADFYSVGSSGSTTPQTIFTSTETPYLYVVLANNTPNFSFSPNVDLTFTSETNPETLNIYSTATYNTSNDNVFWVNLANTLTTQGVWTINGITYTPGNNNIEGYIGQTSLTYTSGIGIHSINAAPEPMGIVLFLLGGGMMAFFLIRRKMAPAVA